MAGDSRSAIYLALFIIIAASNVCRAESKKDTFSDKSIRKGVREACEDVECPEEKFCSRKVVERNDYYKVSTSCERIEETRRRKVCKEDCSSGKVCWQQMAVGRFASLDLGTCEKSSYGLCQNNSKTSCSGDDMLCVVNWKEGSLFTVPWKQERCIKIADE